MGTVVVFVQLQGVGVDISAIVEKMVIRFKIEVIFTLKVETGLDRSLFGKAFLLFTHQVTQNIGCLLSISNF